jgi:L-fuculokinase
MAMNKTKVIAILDIGKTNKKLLLFDEQYDLVHQLSSKMEETVDEDSDPCEDLVVMTISIRQMVKEVLQDDRFDIKAINYTAYGASFVYINKEGESLTPLYNYLKPYPAYISQSFYAKYGGERLVSRITASPVLGSLNSGLQVLRLKKEKPNLFDQVAFALHLPQYLSYLFTGLPVSDITSIGCHTMLWDFEQDHYHDWLKQEQVLRVMAPIAPADSTSVINIKDHELISGFGMHDSSAALVPYLKQFKDPFILISTGTWSICLNPFNDEKLTDEELEADCLCYLQFNGKPVKASRLFLGKWHEDYADRIAKHYALPADFYTAIRFNTDVQASEYWQTLGFSKFEDVDLTTISSPDLAYHLLMADLVSRQIESLSLVLGKESPATILVDGGFSKNDLFMKMMAAALPGKKVHASEVAQATALGAALVLHEKWNETSINKKLIKLVTY